MATALTFGKYEEKHSRKREQHEQRNEARHEWLHFQTGNNKYPVCCTIEASERERLEQWAGTKNGDCFHLRVLKQD